MAPHRRYCVFKQLRRGSFRRGNGFGGMLRGISSVGEFDACLLAGGWGDWKAGRANMQPYCGDLIKKSDAI